MPFRRTLALCATLAAPLAAPAHAATFDILMSYVPVGTVVTGADGVARPAVAFSDRQIELFGMAERFWETVITGFTGHAAPTLSVTASMAPVDGRYRVAAYAGPRNAEYVNGVDPTSGAAKHFLRPTTGTMAFDADDFGPSGGASERTFLTTAIHEISHVLGFGTMFALNGLVGSTPDRYVGRSAVAAFNATHGTALSALALDASSGHWTECWALGATGAACAPEDGSGRRGLHDDSEVLTPYITGGAATIAPASIAALRDLGYLTIDPFSGIALPFPSGPATAPAPAPLPAPAPVPLPAGGLLLLTALGCGVALRRRAA